MAAAIFDRFFDGKWTEGRRFLFFAFCCAVSFGAGRATTADSQGLVEAKESRNACWSREQALQQQVAAQAEVLQRFLIERATP